MLHSCSAWYVLLALAYYMHYHSSIICSSTGIKTRLTLSIRERERVFVPMYMPWNIDLRLLMWSCTKKVARSSPSSIALWFQPCNFYRSYTIAVTYICSKFFIEFLHCVCFWSLLLNINIDWSSIIFLCLY